MNVGDDVSNSTITRWLATLASLLMYLSCAGCSTHAKRIALPRSLFYDGQLQACKENLEKLAKTNRHDRDVVNLDLAIVDLLGGQAKQAETRLKEVRDRFDHLEQDSIAEKTVSMWTDDQTRSYAGEDYEKILIRVYLALANLMHDGTDAESYTLQIQDKHEQLMSRFASNEQQHAADDANAVSSDASNARTPSLVPPTLASRPNTNRYCGLPIGFYLRGMLREQTHHDYDDAYRSYVSTAELLPNCIPLQWDIARVQQGVHSQPGHGVVYVFAMVGRGPYKIEVAEQPTSDALLIADRIVSAVGPYKLPPTIAPIKIPDVVVPQSDVDSVGIAVDGNRIGPTQSIADIEQLAVGTYRASRNSVVARAVARRVIKKATIVAAKGTMGKDGLTSLGMDVVGIAWEATEAADTRCWGLLPRDIQVLRVEVPHGNHQIQMSPLLGSQLVGASRQIPVTVLDGRNTYVLCWFPDARSASQIMCSDSAGFVSGTGTNGMK